MASWTSAKKVFHDRDVGGEEVADVGDEGSDERRLPAGAAQDHRRDEAPAEHVGLELQGGVEDPEQPEARSAGARWRADGEREAAVRSVALVRPCPDRCPCPALRYRRPLAAWPWSGRGSELLGDAVGGVAARPPAPPQVV